MWNLLLKHMLHRHLPHSRMDLYLAPKRFRQHDALRKRFLASYRQSPTSLGLFFYLEMVQLSCFILKSPMLVFDLKRKIGISKIRIWGQRLCLSYFLQWRVSFALTLACFGHPFVGTDPSLRRFSLPLITGLEPAMRLGCRAISGGKA